MVHPLPLSLTWVTVCEQGADGQQHLGDGEGGAPVVLQDVQTDHPLAVDVAVIDPRTKRYLHTHRQCSSVRAQKHFLLVFVHRFNHDEQMRKQSMMLNRV